MTDTPVPPPIPRHLVRPVPPRELELRQKLAKALAELGAERTLNRVLRETYSARRSSDEDTLPGVGAPRRQTRELRRKRRRETALRLGKWALLGSLLGTAAQLASVRYPGLVGPLEIARDLLHQMGVTP